MFTSSEERFRVFHRRGAIACAVIAIALGGFAWFRQASVLPYREHFTLYFTASVNGIYVGSPVRMLGQDIGQVDGIGITAVPRTDGDGFDYYATVNIVVDSKALEKFDCLREGETFRTALPRLVKTGLRGRLMMPSMLANGLCVDLQFAPDAPAKFVSPIGGEYPEIPVEYTSTSEIIDRINAFLETDSLYGISEKVHSLKDSIAAFDKFAEEFDCKAFNERTLAALETAGNSLDPDAAHNSFVSLNSDIVSLCEDIEAQRQISQECADGFCASAKKFTEMLRDVGTAARLLREQTAPEEVESQRLIFEEIRSSCAPLIELGKELLL